MMIIRAERAIRSGLNKLVDACKDEEYFPIYYIINHRDSNNDYYVIHNKCGIVAFGMIRGWDEEWDDKCLGLIVHPDHRGRGYGSLMLHYLETVARNRGLKKLRLHVSPKNHIARKMYEKAFWYPYGRRDDGEIIMYKRLTSDWERERTSMETV